MCRNCGKTIKNTSFNGILQSLLVKVFAVKLNIVRQIYKTEFSLCIFVIYFNN